MSHRLGRALFQDPECVKPQQPVMQDEYTPVESAHYGATHGRERAQAAKLGVSYDEYVRERQAGNRRCGKGRHWVPDADYDEHTALCRPHRRESQAEYRRKKREASGG